MKRAYTSFSPSIKQLTKRSGMSVEETIRAATKNDTPARAELLTWGFVVEYSVMIGKSTHFFLSDIGFCDWLVSCVPHLELHHAMVVKEFLHAGSGCLHFPSNSKRTSMAFDMISNGILDGRKPKEFTENNDGMIVMMWSCGNSEDLFAGFAPLNETGNISPLGMWYAKLVVGLGMYMQCFPEAVKSGPPSDLKHPSHHKYETSLTIESSPKIYGTHDSPIAHFRRGHFRVLASERFTHKRFQTVFVRETFVAGTSKTVLSPEQCDTEAQLAIP